MTDAPLQKNLRLDLRARALELIRYGLPVFPVQPREKAPPKVKASWQHAARTEEAYRALWADFPPDCNIGVSTGGWLLVIDVDVKRASLEEQLRLLSMIYCDLPPTPTTATPSGGRQMYFRAPPDLAVFGRPDHLLPGVDVRWHHNYVLGVGSETARGRYEWCPGRSPADLPFADCPPEILSGILAVGRKRSENAEPTRPACELDLPENIAEARRWLKEEAPEAVENAGGRSVTIRVIHKLGDFGLSPGMQLDLLREEDGWNDTKAFPAWEAGDDRDGLDRLVHDLWGHRERPAGCARVIDAASEFDLVPSVVTESQRRGLYRRTWEESRGRALHAAANPLVKRLLTQGGMSVIYGESNVGKTFAALHLAASIAVGGEWNGWRISQAPVLYVAAEAGEDINPRVEALARHYGWESVPLDVVPCPVNLLDAEADLKALVRLAKETEAAHGGRIGLVVIDTLSRALSGGDENSSTDMGRLVKHIDAIRAATGAHVMVVHHSGKDKARGARGHSLLRAATDTEIELEPGKMKVTKQRGMQGGQEIRFKLAVVELGSDHEGDAVTSCAFDLSLDTALEFQDGQPSTPSASLTPREKEHLQALRQAIELAYGEGSPVAFSSDRGVSAADWECAARESRSKQGGDGGLSRSTLTNLRLTLFRKNAVKKTSENQWVIA